MKRLTDYVLKSKFYGGDFDIARLEHRVAEIEAESSRSEFWDDSVRAKSLNQEMDAHKLTLELFNDIERKVDDSETLLELIQEENDPSLLLEVDENLSTAHEKIAEAQVKLMLSEKQDKLGAVISINAGAGGTESCDWVAMLLRMYLRYCEKKGFKTEMTDFTEGDEAGYRSVTFTVEGEFAYGYLKAEIGVHRLVRISPFDSAKRRHTSFASFFADPLVNDDIEIEINPKDLRIDTYRAGGKGGQNVQKNDTAVRITHLPTNTVVQCQNERSQLQNKNQAMTILKSRLYALELAKQKAAQADKEAEKSANEWGSQIRSYVMHPYRMVKDHRSNEEVGNVDAVMDGDLEPFIKAFLLMKK